MGPAIPRPLHYTFGNHMHWVDMEWLWGAGVLEDSLRDMLALMDATGARGNLNFDGIGYEKLASEAPEALELLKQAVAAGRIEIVGASYGQPYGLFQGGESNVRQRVFGVRAVRRLVGVRPRAFWEEEFDFFPQLPQMLRGCGFTGASLFFQWTWHTPTVPEESTPLIRWEGIDGSWLPTLARTELCLHQWPEDFDGKLELALNSESESIALIQWLELMPSPDWMCRSEVLLPRLRELLSDPRFDVRPGTLSTLIEALDDGRAPVRRYGMESVFHGVSLGKNADRMVRLSHQTEALILAAESASSLAGLCGRPYPSWDVYPTWELEEAWRETLAAQHHDNHECEALCGFVGRHQFEKAHSLASHVLDRTLRLLSSRAGGGTGPVVFNPLGWERLVPVSVDATQELAVRVPAFGYRRVTAEDRRALAVSRVRVESTQHVVRLARDDLQVELDRATGTIIQIRSAEFPEGVLEESRPLLQFRMRQGGAEDHFEQAEVETDSAGVTVRRLGREGALLCLRIELLDSPRRLQLRFLESRLPRPDPGMHAGLQLALAPAFPDPIVFHDTPYAISEIRAEASFQRKYPSGDWMTSPQWFETVQRPFTALTLVDLVAGEAGLLLVHDGSQSFFRTAAGIVGLLHMYDPWDELECHGDLSGACWNLLPHGPLQHLDRARLSAEVRASSLVGGQEPPGSPPDLPATLGALRLEGPALMTAFYRERGRSGREFTRYFGHQVRDPFVVRVVEFDGRGGPLTLHFKGRGAVARTNLMGELEQRLEPEFAAGWSSVRFEVGPWEIATLMLDLEDGRTQPRNLDRHRGVWATVHRQAERQA